MLFFSFEASGEIQILANFSNGSFIKYISLRRLKKNKDMWHSICAYTVVISRSDMLPLICGI